jgi:hypothetical protein
VDKGGRAVTKFDGTHAKQGGHALAEIEDSARVRILFPAPPRSRRLQLPTLRRPIVLKARLDRAPWDFHHHNIFHRVTMSHSDPQ